MTNVKRPISELLEENERLKFECLTLQRQRLIDIDKIDKLLDEVAGLYTRINNSNNSPAPMMVTKGGDNE